MVVSPNRDRRAERREATRAEILEAAWAQARELGLAGVSLREIASNVGMRPPSLYWYFGSKHAIYDAMFAAGNRALLDRIAATDWPDEPRALLRATARMFVEFSAEDGVPRPVAVPADDSRLRTVGRVVRARGRGGGAGASRARGRGCRRSRVLRPVDVTRLRARVATARERSRWRSLSRADRRRRRHVRGPRAEAPPTRARNDSEERAERRRCGWEIRASPSRRDGDRRGRDGRMLALVDGSTIDVVESDRLRRVGREGVAVARARRDGGTPACACSCSSSSPRTRRRRGAAAR